MQDNGFGFELYCFPGGLFSLLHGTNRAKTLEEITKNRIDLDGLKQLIDSIVTKDGIRSRIVVESMARYSLPSIESTLLEEIKTYCNSLGQRPTYSSSHGRCTYHDSLTGELIEQYVDTSLSVVVSTEMIPKDPISNFQSLLKPVSMIK